MNSNRLLVIVIFGALAILAALGIWALIAVLTPAPAVPTATPVSSLDDSWQKVQQAGVLRVATTGDYPPFEYYDAQYRLTGFDIALIQQIGQRLGVRVELNSFAFDGIPSAVAMGQADVAIAALSVTPDRQAIADFSNVYYAGNDAVLSRPEANPQNLNNPAALAVSRLGVQSGSIYETYAQQKLIGTGLMPKQNLYVYSDITQAVNDLKARRLDAVWLDLDPAQSFVNMGGVKIIAQGLNPQIYSIGMKKGANSLRDKLNQALTGLLNDGTLAMLEQQYLGISPEDFVPPPPLPTPVPAQPTPVPPGCLDGAGFVASLSYDDKDMKEPPVLRPGEAFIKGWRLRNTGTCTWKTGYSLAYSYGNVPAAQMGGQPVPVTKEVRPNETYDFYATLTTPIVAGTYQGFWDMRNPQNQKFGQTVWVGIRVVDNATPTPQPTQTPVPNISFAANPTSVTAGQPVYFTWQAGGASAAYFYHDGQNWQDHPVATVGQATDYPPYTMNYYLRVVQANGAVVNRSIGIAVKPAVGAPVITYLSATPPQINTGQCVTIDWTVTGQVDRVTLLVNGAAVWDPAPVSGNYPDCPARANTYVYTLQASGPGGTSTQQVSVSVQDVPQPPTSTPTPYIPVVPPPVVQSFSIAPNSIEQGQCVTASWSTGAGTTRVQLLRDGAVILDNASLNNSVPDCPPNAAPSQVQYTLIAYNNNGQQDSRETWVQVTSAPPQNLLANTNWQLLTMQGAGAVPAEVNVTAYFGSDGSLSGFSGCNSYTGSYMAEGQVITIRVPVATGALCGDPSGGIEQTYLGLLPQAANFRLDNGQLVILDNTGQEILRYNALVT